MAARFPDKRLRFLIGDIRDRERLGLAFRGVDLVFHAAALKRVEACEYDPDEAVKTNIIGTANVIHAALEAGCHVVFLSSDKACAPVTLYGFTKAAAENYVIQANAYLGGPPRFSVMRYGNVAGSQGSVIPLWRRLVDEGRKLPITDLRMTRFWMTIDEAVDFALWVAGQPAGRTYVPRMPSFKLVDLAFAIQRSTTPLDVIGMRGVEKLHEDIVAPYETGIVSPWDGPMRSDKNTDWLDVAELTKRLEGV
jgi:UDP-N-acetylglucosamine 4,6-dehydratase